MDINWTFGNGSETIHFRILEAKVELSTDYKYGAIKRGHIRASGILSPVLLQDVVDSTFCGIIPISSVRRHPVAARIVNMRMDEIGFSPDHEVVCVLLWAGFRVNGLLLIATDETGREHQAGRLT